MTSHAARLYALVASVLVLFVAWAAIAARPWQAAAKPALDPRVAALVAREQRLRRDAVLVRRVVEHRWAVYRVRLAQRQSEIARAKTRQAAANSAAAAAARRAAATVAPAPVPATATPSVRVVTLPPLTITRTS